MKVIAFVAGMLVVAAALSGCSTSLKWDKNDGLQYDGSLFIIVEGGSK